MTSWLERAEFQSGVKLTGPYGGKVRVGRFIVPRHVFLDVTGGAGDPSAHIHFEWRDGRPQAVEVRVTAAPDGRGIGSSDLDALTLDAMATTVFQRHSTVVVAEGNGVTTSAMVDWSHPKWERDGWQLSGELTEAISSSRGRRTATELERVAEIYRERRGKDALTYIATALDVSLRTAARRVKAARQVGLISEIDTSEGAQ